MSDQGFTHLDPLGRARMVDVTPKDPSHRRAIARAKVHMTPKPRRPSLAARWARAMCLLWLVWPGFRRPSAPPSSSRCVTRCSWAVLVNFRLEETYIEVEAEVETYDRTGVEMEALTACSVAALTIYDMCKSRDRAMVIGDIALWEKTGGRSGTYRRESDEATADHDL